MVCIYHTATWMSLCVSCALHGTFVYVEFSIAVQQRVGHLPAMANATACVPHPPRVLARSDIFIPFSVITTV